MQAIFLVFYWLFLCVCHQWSAVGYSFVFCDQKSTQQELILDLCGLSPQSSSSIFFCVSYNIFNFTFIPVTNQNQNKSLNKENISFCKYFCSNTQFLKGDINLLLYSVISVENKRLVEFFSWVYFFMYLLFWLVAFSFVFYFPELLCCYEWRNEVSRWEILLNREDRRMVGYISYFLVYDM